MARTQLFRWLRHHTRNAPTADDLRPPVDLRRRALLRQLGMLGGLLTATRLSARPRATGTVLVVGAGLAGLTCAWRLLQAGLDVTVIEAQDRVGGRAHSLRGDRLQGSLGELGGEFVDRDHGHIQQLVKALNADLRKGETPLLWDRIRAFDERHGLRDDVIWVDGALRSGRDIVSELRKVADHVRADAAQRSHASPKRRSWQALDEMTLDAYLHGMGQLADRPAPWLRNLLAAAWTAEYGLDATSQSALNFISAFGDFYSERHVQWQDPDVECLHLRGGNDLLATRLATRVTDGGKLLLGTALVALRPHSAGGWMATVEASGSRRDIRADGVVLALPFSRLRQADLKQVPLSPQKRSAIQNLGYGTNTKVITAMRGQPWRLRGLSGATMGDTRYGVTWDSSRPDVEAARTDPAVGVLTQFRGGAGAVAACMAQDTGSADAALAAIAQVMAAATPHAGAFDGAQLAALRIAAPVYANWAVSPVALGSYACYRSGQWTAFGGSEGAAEPGAPKLVFSGEHTAQEAQGYLEGAVESGVRAARELLGAMDDD